MLTNKNKLTEELKKGWVFDILTPLLFEQLKKLPQPEKVTTDDITLLMLNRYKIIADFEVGLMQKNIIEMSSNVNIFLDKKNITFKLISNHFELAQPTEQFSKQLQYAIDSLLEIDPKLVLVFSYINKFILVNNAAFRSASHPHLLFTIVLNTDSFGKFKNDLALSIIHELAHQELFLLNLVDRLVMVESTYNLVHAPYQGKLRPPIGRLHSCHALFRMLQYSGLLGVPKEKTLKFEKIFLENITGFHENELTSFSGEMLKHVYQK